jgi:hypothetical protein
VLGGYTTASAGSWVLSLSQARRFFGFVRFLFFFSARYQKPLFFLVCNGEMRAYAVL